jgi:hypothetical protein
VTHLKRLGLAPPRMGFNISYFTNKVVRVTGLVVAEEELATEKTKYYVVVEDLDQLEVVR